MIIDTHSHILPEITIMEMKGLEGQFPSIKLSQDADNYKLVFLDEKGFAPSTKARRLSALREYFKFLRFSEEGRSDDPAMEVDKVSSRVKRGENGEFILDLDLKKLLTEEDVERLLLQAEFNVQEKISVLQGKAKTLEARLKKQKVVTFDSIG